MAVGNHGSLHFVYMPWFVYIVRCADDSLYTGVSNDVAERVKAHNDSKSGARYTKSRRPVTLVYQERKRNKSYALKREAEIKGWTRGEKEKLVSGE